MFRDAFKQGWKPFDRPGFDNNEMEIKEEDSFGEDSDFDEEEKKVAEGESESLIDSKTLN